MSKLSLEQQKEKTALSERSAAHPVKTKINSSTEVFIWWQGSSFCFVAVSANFWRPLNMAQANITPVLNIPPFKGTENFEEFEQQPVSSIGIQNTDRHLYFHLHLKGGALAYYDQLPRNTRQDYEAAIASRRQRYVNP